MIAVLSSHDTSKKIFRLQKPPVSNKTGGSKTKSEVSTDLQTGGTQVGVKKDGFDLGWIVPHTDFTTFRIDLNFFDAIQSDGFFGAFLPVAPVHTINPK
jgi:hypothetical protein